MKNLILSCSFVIGINLLVFSQDLNLKKNISSVHSGAAITSLAINNDGTKIITCGSDKRTNLWDVKSGDKLKPFGGHTDIVTTSAINASNTMFITAGLDSRIIMWDFQKIGSVKKILKGHISGVLSVAFNPINDFVASGSKDNTIMLWDGATSSPSQTLNGHSKEVTAVTFSSDGKLVVSGSADNTIKIWDAESGQLKKTIEANTKGVTSISYSSDGKYIASGGENELAILWDAQAGNQITDFEGHQGKVNAVLFSPDVQYLVTAGADGKIIVWDLETRQTVINFAAHTKAINTIAFNDNGTLFASAGEDGDLKIWDVTNLKIGKKKFIKDEAEPKLVCSPLSIKEGNQNGIIEAAENASINFTIENKGQGKAYSVVARTTMGNIINGLGVEKEYLIGNLDAGITKEVSIPITAKEDMDSDAGSFTVSIIEANGFNPTALTANFQTRGVQQYSYIMVLEHGYSSATGKADVGAPITLKLKLKNTSQGEAKNIKVNYIFPDNVMAVNKISEIVPLMKSNEEKEVSVEFYATESFSQEKIVMGLSIEGAFSNANDLLLVVNMKEPLPPTETYAVQTLAMNQPTYRGGGDMLKGLNVSKAKDMVVGQYYALIIGVDKYKGHWTPLQNAVRDAKAIETLLKAKYKFDHFKNLYNETATRNNIITELEWLVSNVRPQDNVFIYYSGHGEFKQDLNKGYWVPVDAESQSTAQYISNSDLQTYLGGIKSKHTLLVSDACFSGDIFRGATVTVPFEESEKYYKEVSSLSSRQAITSGGIEPVMDGGKEGHSVFAYYFLKVLENNNARYFDAGQLYNKVKIPVINNSEQTPKIAPIKNTGDEGGQFLFIKK